MDVLVEFDRQHPIGVIEYARVRLYIDEILNGAGDVINSRTIKPLLRDGILRDSVNAF